MKPESILSADIIDIIFENRNKDYGAYELRSQYDKRLKKAMLIIFITVAIILSINYWVSTHLSHHIGSIPVYDSVLLGDYIPPNKKELIKPLPVERKKIATAKLVTPLIVRSEHVDPPATIDELQQKQIGLTNMIGDKVADGEIPHPAVEGNKQGNEVKEQSGKPEETIFKTAEVMPEFPGGIEALKRFLSRNLRMPGDGPDPGTIVRVLASFVVDKEGNITSIAVQQSGGSDFDNEVIRVMKKMPRWKPGIQNGNKVAVYFNLPVVFQAPDGN